MEKQRQAKNTNAETLSFLWTEATLQDPSFVGLQRKRGEGLLPSQCLQQSAARSTRSAVSPSLLRWKAARQDVSRCC